MGKIDHSSAGALHAVNKNGQVGRILAYLIAGHHAGLPNWTYEPHGGGPYQTDFQLLRTYMLP